VASPKTCVEFVRGEDPRMTLDSVLIVYLYVRASDTVVSPHCSRPLMSQNTSSLSWKSSRKTNSRDYVGKRTLAIETIGRAIVNQSTLQGEMAWEITKT
jgi:hypothetical protein